MSDAAPMPWRVRAAISRSGDVASAHRAEARVKTPMPITKTRRRPNRSPRATAMRMNVANDSEYALMNH